MLGDAETWIIHIQILLPMPLGRAVREKGRRRVRESLRDEFQGFRFARFIANREIELLVGETARGRALGADVAMAAAFIGLVLVAGLARGAANVRGGGKRHGECQHRHKREKESMAQGLSA
ncbi:MAG: hypothetical protein FJ398_23025 [Verrucomicrobia bacterium]|nr:hypothetical protein [Verrucomicrobiota bacterium]